MLFFFVNTVSIQYHAILGEGKFRLNLKSISMACVCLSVNIMPLYSIFVSLLFVSKF